MSSLLQRLQPRERRGSKPRCHVLTYGTRDKVAARLTDLAAPFATVSPNDYWMPEGFDELEEAQLHRASRLINPAISAQLGTWWLSEMSQNSKTPNFDIASSCRIDGLPGILLVEAKAHTEELHREIVGKRLRYTRSADNSPRVSKGAEANHAKIGSAIAAACEGLEKSTSLRWHVSRNYCYQMSNRFAWAWKLTELGIPVVLIYLGFLNANEMADKGAPITDEKNWEGLVKEHSKRLMPPEVWGRRWVCNGLPLIPLIRSIEGPLEPN